MLVFSFVLIFSGCGSNQTDGKKEINNAVGDAVKDAKVDSATTPLKESREECMTGCVMLWKNNKDNAAKTEDEMNKYCNQLCDAGQGMKNLDPESCAKGEGAYKETCYLNVARDTVDAGLCEKIEKEPFRSTCYRDISVKNGDKALCEKVTIKYIKDSCLKK